MAFTNFYLIAGGTGSADINAGSSIGAAQATTTNGNWTSTTGVFIAASGTPFASTIIGDYASVYVDGATVTTFVGKVTVVTSSTRITVDIATLKYGTVPTTSATARSCTINGSWNTEQVLAAGGLATTTIPQSTKINMKGNLTITASRTISMAGATTKPLWFSGYNTTPGDLDNDTTNTLAKPVWTFGTGFTLTTSGASAIWSGVTLTGSLSGTFWSSSGVAVYASRLRVTNTNAGINANALSISGGMVIEDSYFSVPATATGNPVITLATAATLLRCVVEGSGLALFNIASNACRLDSCILLNGVVGILASTGMVIAQHNTLSSLSSHGVQWTGAPPLGAAIQQNVFRKITGTAVNNSSGTNSANVMRSCNAMYTVGARENGFGDSPEFFPVTCSTDPCVSDSDLTSVLASFPVPVNGAGIYENEPFTSYTAIGAVGAQVPSGFSGGIFGG